MRMKESDCMDRPTRSIALFIRNSLVVVLALGGCVAEPADTAQVASTYESLVGGVNTTLRPEVGTMQEQTGNTISGCTATLIGSRYALTAGHCVNYSTNRNSATVKLPISSTPYTV